MGYGAHNGGSQPGMEVSRILMMIMITKFRLILSSGVVQAAAGNLP